MFKITLNCHKDVTTLYGFTLEDLKSEAKKFLDAHKHEDVFLTDKDNTDIWCRYTYTIRKDAPHKVAEELEEYLDVDCWGEPQFDPVNNPEHAYYELAYTYWYINDDNHSEEMEEFDTWETACEAFLKRTAKRGCIKVVYQEEWDRLYPQKRQHNAN